MLCCAVPEVQYAMPCLCHAVLCRLPETAVQGPLACKRHALMCNAVPSSAMLGHAVLCHAAPCCAMLCCAVSCFAMPCCAVLCRRLEQAVRWSAAVQRELLEMSWPETLLQWSDCQPQQDPNTGALIWRGLRVRMGISWGRPSYKKPLNTGMHTLCCWPQPTHSFVQEVSQYRSVKSYHILWLP